jgi:hypothetical protein
MFCVRNLNWSHYVLLTQKKRKIKNTATTQFVEVQLQ